MRDRWDEQLKTDASSITDDAAALIGEMAKRLQATYGDTLKDYADLMDEEQRKSFTDEVAKSSMLSNIAGIMDSGAYVSYAPASFILTLYRADPDLFFGDTVWSDDSASIPDGFLDPTTVAKAKQAGRDQYMTCLECVVRFLGGNVRNDHDYLDFTRAATSFLRNHMVDNV